MVVERLGRPFARGEFHAAGLAVRNHMHGVETVAAFEGRSHLPRRGAGGVENDGFDSLAQIAEDGVEIGGADINEG
jgi:hypothetical protein